MRQAVGIFGVPRTGTSWLGQIYNSSPDVKFSYQPMFTQEFRYKVHPNSTVEEIAKFVDDMYLSKNDFLSQKDSMIKAERMHFHKETENPKCFVFKEVMYLYMIPVFLENLDLIKIVFLVRDPIGVLTSWYNSPKEFYPEWNIYDEWQYAQKKNMFLPERYYGYYKWKEAMVLACDMYKKYPDRIKFIHYEELCDDPIERTKELFQFSGLEFKDQTREFIIDTQSRTEESDPYSVFRKKRAREQIRRELPDDIADFVKEDLAKFIPYLRWDCLKAYQ